MWVLAAPSAAWDRKEALRARGLEVLDVDVSAPGRLDLRAALRLLAERRITRVLLEGGPILAAAMIAADVVDEVALFEGRMQIGPDGIDALEGMPTSALKNSPRFKSAGEESVGADRLQHFVRA